MAKTSRGETIIPDFDICSDNEVDSFHLCLTSDIATKIGEAVLEIYYKPPTSEEDYPYPANSAVLFDIQIDEDYRHKGRGSELLDIVVQYAKSQGATKFFAEHVKDKPWFKKRGFTPTDDNRDVWRLVTFV
jgi:GNAT superfamily N-acetyltransferase